MKVLYIIDFFPKISETFILNEMIEAQKNGIDVCVYAFNNPNEIKRHPRVANIDALNYLKPCSDHKILASHLRWFLKSPFRYAVTALLALIPSNNIDRLFLQHLDDITAITLLRPDHIHAHFGLQSSNFAMLVNLLTGIPFTFTTHRVDLVECPPPNYLIKSRLAKKHITISEYNKVFISDKFRVPKNMISVVRCGVDLSILKPRANKKSSISAPTIATIARLAPEKGLDCLVKACALLSAKSINFRCVIAGDGPEHSFLTALIHKLGMQSHIRLAGNLTQNEVFDLLRAATITILPSRSEGISVALMEAMALKVPVIGPNISGIGELIDDGINGFLIEPDDIETLAKKMEILLSDKALRDAFSENGRKKIEDCFDLHKNVNTLINIWKS